MSATAGYGFTGKTLRVDLTTNTISTEDTLTKYGKFWGGTGLAYKVMWDEVPASVEPYDAENRIIFGWGPTAGTGAPSASGRTAITTLLPGNPHHAVGHGHMGGSFCSEAKYAGWDSMIVQGKAAAPVWIAVRDYDPNDTPNPSAGTGYGVQILSAAKMWGNGIYRATAEVMEAMGAGAHVAAIGQAGENLVVMSNVMCDVSHSAGAVGSVLGSKNLKAIGVVGTGGVKIALNKRGWRALVDNCMALLGAYNQVVTPTTPQPWSEYSGGSRWGAGKNVYWRAATPPVHLGVCEPHDRQSIGYRSYSTSYGGGGTAPWIVRQDGCHGCPLRCHVCFNMPSVARWGGQAGAPDGHASNICSGLEWFSNMRDDTKTTGDEGKIRQSEAVVVGIHVADDYGLWSNYRIVEFVWPWLYSGGAKTSASGITDGGVSYIKPNVPAAEWTDLTTNLFPLYEAGDMNFLFELGRRMAFKVGVFGAAMGGRHQDMFATWVDKNGASLAAPFLSSSGLKYWGWDANGGGTGGMSHHEGVQVGNLINTGYNRDPTNHTHTKLTGPGLPALLTQVILEEEFAACGFGPGMGAAYDASGVTPINAAKAKFAKFCACRLEVHNALGMCDWVYPLAFSPLRERGYRGDLTLEARIYSAVTGDTKSMADLDTDGERFYTLQRALTIRKFNNMNMRALHDRLPAWLLGSSITSSTDTIADWEASLDLYYDAWGYDRATGAPTRATLERLGMKDVADQLAGLGLLP